MSQLGRRIAKGVRGILIIVAGLFVVVLIFVIITISQGPDEPSAQTQQVANLIATREAVLALIPPTFTPVPVDQPTATPTLSPDVTCTTQAYTERETQNELVLNRAINNTRVQGVTDILITAQGEQEVCGDQVRSFVVTDRFYQITVTENSGDAATRGDMLASLLTAVAITPLDDTREVRVVFTGNSGQVEWALSYGDAMAAFGGRTEGETLYNSGLE